MAWGKSSGRSSPLPRAWKMIRANVLRRDNYECQQVREDTGLKCRAKATDVDHIDDPNDHRHSNLQSLCSYHHDQKTAGQGGSATAAAKRKRAKAKAHPGVVYLTTEDD